MAKRPSDRAIGAHFLEWQCRIRQVAMREEGGRPSPGMQPRVLDGAGLEMAPALTVLMIPKEPEESTAFFRYQVMKTPDPRAVYERALTFLQADYFQDPDAFSDRLRVRAVCRAPRWRPRCSKRANASWSSSKDGSAISFLARCAS